MASVDFQYGGENSQLNKLNHIKYQINHLCVYLINPYGVEILLFVTS